MTKENQTKQAVVGYRFLILLAALFFAVNSAGAVVLENDSITPIQYGETVFEIVEKMPEYPGGMAEMMKFLSSNIKYPAEAQEKSIVGRVIIQFIVDKEGTVKDPVVIRSVDPAFDKEALRVVGLMPKWSPGMQRGENVAVKYTIPISFNLTKKAEKGNMKPVDKIEEIVVVGYGGSSTEKEQIYEIVEQMPEFENGKEGLQRYLAQNIKYPLDAAEQGKEGLVLISVVINKYGMVTQPMVLKSAHPLLDAEAIRVAMNMPKWNPGKQNGKAVSVKYTIPMTFKLQ